MEIRHVELQDYRKLGFKDSEILRYAFEVVSDRALYRKYIIE